MQIDHSQANVYHSAITDKRQNPLAKPVLYWAQWCGLYTSAFNQDARPKMGLSAIMGCCCCTHVTRRYHVVDTKTEVCPQRDNTKFPKRKQSYACKQNNMKRRSHASGVNVISCGEGEAQKAKKNNVHKSSIRVSTLQILAYTRIIRVSTTLQ